MAAKVNRIAWSNLGPSVSGELNGVTSKPQVDASVSARGAKAREITTNYYAYGPEWSIWASN